MLLGVSQDLYNRAARSMHALSKELEAMSVVDTLS